MSERYKISPDAIKEHAGKKHVAVVWMEPEQYLALCPALEKNHRTDKQGQSLKASLDKGEDIHTLPMLEVIVTKGKAKVEDQDGRHRAKFAKDRGIGLIPVAIKGMKGKAERIIGMTGHEMPFNFEPVRHG